MDDSEFRRLVEEREIALLRMILATGRAMADGTQRDPREMADDDIPQCVREAFPRQSAPPDVVA